jgi:hypothetical protein
MPRPKFALALIALALIALAATAHATWYSESLYVPSNASNYTGYFEFYQGLMPVYDTVLWYPGNPIRWYCKLWPTVPPERAYPRDNGYCLFYVPHFNAISTPICTLYYYQADHSGSANLLVNLWENPLNYWGPADESDYDECYFAIWNSHDTVATDVAHSTDGVWYKVPLTQMACAAILDTAAANQNGALLYTGWVYPGSVDGTFTEAHGYDGYDNHPPFIKVYYEWQ